ncbi:hypothetical protein [Nonomuraea africana]|uniref:Uncharacterized protein n=1 Tax=Nonomuraea africana TaxID=46171 RepID=A0ABR9KHW1_9ACTN|nr:hypothetical protein [Nonomuraea africana]MBE1561405.1 hypothetical protein [Nonomuraea africana]
MRSRQASGTVTLHAQRLIGGSTASSAVITGLIIAVMTIGWATSFLKPPAAERAAEPSAPAEPSPELA